MFRFRSHNRNELLATPLPESWLGYLRENVFLYRLLSEEEQARLRGAVNIFVAEKNWEGCAGLCVTDEMRVSIAAQACLLILGFDGYYFDDVDTVLIYPGGYLSGDPSDANDVPRHLSGQAHRDGPVVLSWWQVRWDGRRAGRNNLVLHEFAHQLTRRGDRHFGVPPMDDADLEQRWRKVVKNEHRRLIDAVQYGRATLLDPYGAANRAEFFAVATESFFLQPEELLAEHPRLYGVLAEWFRQDPASRRQPSAEERAEAERAEREQEEHILAECNAAIRLRPHNAGAYLNRADFYAQRGEHEKAIADLTKAIHLDPKNADAYCDRGSAFFASGDLERAIADFSAAIRWCRNYAHAYRERGAARAAAGDLEGAKADLRRAIRLDPKDDVAYFERAQVHRDQGKHRMAVRDFSKAIRLYPHEAVFFCGRARSLLELGEKVRAVADCTKAIRLDPEHAEAYRIRAQAHEARGEMDKARKDRMRADELTSQDDQRQALIR